MKKLTDASWSQKALPYLGNGRRCTDGPTVLRPTDLLCDISFTRGERKCKEQSVSEIGIKLSSRLRVMSHF